MIQFYSVFDDSASFETVVWSSGEPILALTSKLSASTPCAPLDNVKTASFRTFSRQRFSCDQNKSFCVRCAQNYLVNVSVSRIFQMRECFDRPPFFWCRTV